MRPWMANLHPAQWHNTGMAVATRHRGRTLVLAGACVLAWGIITSELIQLQRAHTNDPLDTLTNLQGQQPWGGQAARLAAAQLSTQWRLQPERAHPALAWALSRYPLDPWRWLTLARLEHAQQVNHASIQHRLVTAWSVQPEHRSLNWEILNLTQRLGDSDAVLEAIRRWVAGQPRAVGAGLFVAGRWVDDLPQALDRVLPSDDEAYWAEALSHARRNRLPRVAEAAWAALPKPRPLGDQALDDYAVHLASTGAVDRLRALWSAHDPSYPDTLIPAGHFHVARESLSAFGWNTRTPAGVSVQQHHEDLPPDFRVDLRQRFPHWTGLMPGALTVRFDGAHNVNLSTPRLRMPAPEPGRYRLHGWWRASGLTTRSLPTLEIVTLKDRGRVQVPLPNRNLPWARFEADFEITEDDDRLIIQWVRRPTQNFDRNIQGEVAFTGLRLEHRPEQRAMQPPDTDPQVKR